MLINTTEKIPIKEVYFGKTPEIQKIEKQLDVFRSKYLGRYLTAITVNNDPDLLKFNRMIEDQFGFGCFTLHIINEPMINAFTMPIDTRYEVFNTNKNLIADKRTFKFKKEADYTAIVCIYSGLIFNPVYSTDEIMAMIMHEIGHNFYAALDKKHGIFSNFYAALVLVSSIMNIVIDLIVFHTRLPIDITNAISNSDLYQKLANKFDRFLRENDTLIIKVFDVIDFFGNLVNVVKLGLLGFIDIVTLGSLHVLGSLLSTATSVPFSILSLLILGGRYQNERLADNFATMYGYGDAFISAMNKMSSKETPTPSKIMNAFNKIPVLSDIYAINASIGDIVIHVFDEHPDYIARCYDQIEMLEREASKSDLDPKMKKVIMQDIKACKTKIKYLIEQNQSLKNKDVVRNAYNRFLYENFKSKGLKDMIFDDVNKFDIYDRTYDEKRIK